MPDGSAPPEGPRSLPNPARPPMFRHPKRVAIIAGTWFAIAVLVAIAIGSADTSDLQAHETVPKAVQGVSPAAGAIVGPDASISVDLQDDLIGEFTVCAPTPNDCTPVPLDQTHVVTGLGQVSFKPTDTTDITEFPAGPVSVRVDYHLQGSLTAEAGSYTWSFVVKA
ncbi:MAG: hypothetical protein ACXVJ7_07380 [Acidimicrobiia bacterium]